MNGLERIERFHYPPKSPFIYDTTKMAIGVLKGASDSSTSNWDQEIALILSPVAILALPATLIADTVSLPYDYYLDKKITPNVDFWKKQFVRNKKINKSITDQEKKLYEKNFNEIGALMVYQRFRQLSEISATRILFLSKLASNNLDYKYSSKAISLFFSNYGTSYGQTKSDILTITLNNIDDYKNTISGIIRAPYNIQGSEFAEKYYNLMVSGEDITKASKVKILEALIYAHTMDWHNVERGEEEKAEKIKEVVTKLKSILESTK